MRSWTALLIAALFGIGAASQSSARMASHIRTIPAKQFIDLAPGEYQAGSIAIHVREVRGKENPHNFIVDFSSHGRKPLRVQIDDHGFDVTPPTFAVGQLEKTGPAVFFVEMDQARVANILFLMSFLTSSIVSMIFLNVFSLPWIKLDFYWLRTFKTVN